MSTGMCTMDEIENAVDVLRTHGVNYELLHCVSTYPMKDEDANLEVIHTLEDEFLCKVGYSGHESGIQISTAAVALGATSIERHITLDRAMTGSDQAASLEPEGLKRLVRDIRIIDNAMGDGVKRITEEEKKIRKKLGNPYWIRKLKNGKRKHHKGWTFVSKTLINKEEK
jgi:N-acetylneuraminate synthase